MSRPTYCQQPKPCDYDERDAYCIHTECRRAAADQTKALRAENERLKADIQYMVTKAATKHRPAYDEQQRVIMDLRADNERLTDELRLVTSPAESVGGVINALRARVAELEAERNEPVTLSEWQKLKAENGRLREALGAIIHAWDSDDDWMGNDPAEIARAALEGREK